MHWAAPATNNHLPRQIEEELFEEGLVVKDEDFLQNDIQDPDKGLSFVEKRKSDANELSDDDDFPRSPSRSPSSTGR